MPKLKVSIGIPFYGSQDPKFWKPLAEFTYLLNKINVELVGIPVSGGMMADSNRNRITAGFLGTNSEWLFWIDGDNNYTVGGLKRLLDINKTLVSGVYFAKKHPYNLIAYYRLPNGLYKPLSTRDYERGEIIPVDGAGCGGLLTHRSVYEDIQNNYTVLQRGDNSAILAIHNDDIVGDISETASHPYDGKIHKGQYRLRMRPLDERMKAKPFPWFSLEHGRTEDFDFFEKAARVGHKCWLDTSVEGGHVTTTQVTGEIARKVQNPQIVTKEIPMVNGDPYNMEEVGSDEITGA